jgi:carboxyl-terminal processing protease
VLSGLLCGASACHKRTIVSGFPDQYVGVGIELTMQGDQPVVARVMSGSAAEEAGVHVGDRLLAVDTESVSGKTLGDVVMRIRAAPRAQVTLTISRDGAKMVMVVRRHQLKKEKGAYHRAGDKS